MISIYLELISIYLELISIYILNWSVYILNWSVFIMNWLVYILNWSVYILNWLVYILNWSGYILNWFIYILNSTSLLNHANKIYIRCFMKLRCKTPVLQFSWSSTFSKRIEVLSLGYYRKLLIQFTFFFCWGFIYYHFIMFLIKNIYFPHHIRLSPSFNAKNAT